MNKLKNDINFLKKVFESISEGVVIHDAEGAIVHFNRAALTILGLSADELCGKTPMDPRWNAMKEDGSDLTGGEHPASVTRNTKVPVRNFIMKVGVPSGESRWLSVSSDVFELNAAEFFVVATFSDVTALKLAKEKLQIQQERWRLGLKASRIGIWEYDLVSNVLHGDEEMLRMYGLGPDDFEVTYEVWQRALHEEDRERAEAESAQAIAGAKELNTKFRVRTSSGEIRWIEAVAEVVKDVDGKPIKMIGANIDVTRTEEIERLAARKSADLERELQRFELVTEGSSVGIWDWFDVNQNQEYWSPKFYQHLGYEVGEIEASLEMFTTLLHPDDRAPTFEMVQEHFAGKRSFDIEYRLRTKSGDYRWFRGTGHASRDRAGKPVRMVGSIMDIHEQKLLNDKLKRTTAFVESIVLNSPVIKIACDNAGTITLFNPAAELALGYTASEVVGIKAARELLDPNEIVAFATMMEAETGVVFEDKARAIFYRSDFSEKNRMEFSFIRKDGSRFPAEVLLAALRSEKGEIDGYISIATDISERKKAERITSEATNRIKQAFEAAPNGMMTVGADGVIVFANKAIQEMFGYTAEQLVGMNVDSLVPAKIRETHNTKRDSFFRNPVKRPLGVGMTLFGTKNDGSEFPVEIGLSPMSSHEGSFALVSVVDITERKRNEEKIAETLNELGRSNAELESFAYIASHDLQAPLRHISSYADLLKSKLNLDSDPESAKWMRYIFDGTQTMKELIDGLLSYSRVRGAEEGFVNVDLDKSVAKVTRILKSTFPELTVTAPALPALPGYPSQLTQLFQNLMQNAVKFRKPNLAPEIKITVADKGGDYYFEVVDNGIGIAKEHFDRVFILFQRLHSKEKYEGTGLGLAICKKVVALHGGRIWIESDGQTGTKVCFTLKKRELVDKDFGVPKVGGKAA